MGEASAISKADSYFQRLGAAGFQKVEYGRRKLWVLKSYRSLVEQIGFSEGEPKVSSHSEVGGRKSHSIYQLTPGVGGSDQPHGLTASGTFDGQWLWKKCSRGGMVEKILKDRFLRIDRFYEELLTLHRLQKQGFPVARIVALAIEGKRGPGFRVEQLVEVVPSSQDLAVILEANTPSHELRITLEIVADLLRKFHGASFVHGDLNLKNILISRDSDQKPTAFLIDLDPGSAKLGGGGGDALSNMLRLYRSYLKGEKQSKWQVSRPALLRFLLQYYRGDQNAMRIFVRKATALH